MDATKHTEHPTASAFVSALGVNATVQLLLLLAGGLMLDGGRLGAVVMILTLGYWAGIALMWRRWRCPTRTDLFLARFGFILLVPVFVILTAVVSRFWWGA